jgi:hypothetical protein
MDRADVMFRSSWPELRDDTQHRYKEVPNQYNIPPGALINWATFNIATPCQSMKATHKNSTTNGLLNINLQDANKKKIHCKLSRQVNENAKSLSKLVLIVTLELLPG